MNNIKKLIQSLQTKNKKLNSELDKNPKIIFKRLQNPNQLNTGWYGFWPGL